jgi:hypothetical protein
VAWPEYGVKGGGDVRRVRRHVVGWAARRGYGGTAAHGCEARGAKEEGRDGGSMAHGPTGRRLPRHSDLRGRSRRARATRRDATRRGAVRRSGSKPFQVPYFKLNFLKFSKQNCTRV